MVRSEELLERLRAAAAAFLDPRLACAGHGNFCEHQIILTEGRTAVFDWDRCDMAHPVRDVAKFMVSLERLAMKHLAPILRALDSATEVFLRAYLGSGRHSDVPASLPFYKAVFWLKRRTQAIQTRAAGWREQAEIMLGESFRNLQALCIHNDFRRV